MPVYVIQAGDTEFVKIGWADNPATRLRELQTSHHETLQILRVIEGDDTNLERRFHKRFSALRVRGEWFRFHPDMLTIELERISTAKPQPKKLNLPRGHRSEPSALGPLLGSAEPPEPSISSAAMQRWLPGDGEYCDDRHRAWKAAEHKIALDTLIALRRANEQQAAMARASNTYRVNRRHPRFGERPISRGTTGLLFDRTGVKRYIHAAYIPAADKPPSNGARECARRRRQIAAGQLTAAGGVST